MGILLWIIEQDYCEGGMGQKDNDNRNNWYQLDNAGILYSAIASSRSSTVFRLTIGLDHDVDPEVLQRALDNTMPRFPYFQVNLKRGFFWYYYEHTDKRVLVEKEAHYPCKSIRLTSGVFPFRVLYYRRYIHLEMSHAIADGLGGMQFLKPLVMEYFYLKEGIVCKDTDRIIDIHGEIDPEEFEDSFKKNYEKKVPPPPRGKTAYHLPFDLLDKGQYLLLTGICPVKEMIRAAKEQKSTLTQFITALYFEAIQEYARKHLKPRKNGTIKGRIAINIPVDLRQFYGSKTMRNFFISLNPAIDLELGEYSRKELLVFVRGYMGLYINQKNIKRYISRNVRNEEFIFLRVIPLWLKKLVMPIIYNVYGESGYTSSVSNLGVFTMPEELADRITLFEGFPAPSAGNKIKIVLSSYGDNLYISCGKTTNAGDIERILFRKIREMGIPVKIEGNQLNYY